jgi:hypothetical protein
MTPARIDVLAAKVNDRIEAALRQRDTRIGSIKAEVAQRGHERFECCARPRDHSTPRRLKPRARMQPPCAPYESAYASRPPLR